MKKILCTLVLACVIMSAAFAQQQRPATPAPAPAPAPTTPVEAPKNNSFGLDLFQLFKGFIATDTDNNFSFFIISADYERLIAPHFSIGADLDLYFMNFDGSTGNYFSIAGEGRYYPMSSNFEKFFLGTTIGFNLLSIDNSTSPEDGAFSGLTISLKTGYKLIINNKMYLEPSLAYVLSKSSIMGAFFGLSIPTPLGWNGGLRLGFVF